MKKLMGKMKRVFSTEGTGSARPPRSVENLFDSLAAAGKGKPLTAADLEAFLVSQQKESSEERAAALVEYGAKEGSQKLTLSGFYQVLTSLTLNNARKPKAVNHDMTAPLAHYFILTGHNSYLSGNQLTSGCSIEPIIEALHRGCRVVELDIWPGGKDGKDIVVTHGGTLTAPVSFEDCIKAIQEHAFKASPYPLIVTLEDHLTAELQSKAADIIERILGDVIYKKQGPFAEFPSPESLKGRILFSTKVPSKVVNDEAEVVPGGRDGAAAAEGGAPAVVQVAAAAAAKALATGLEKDGGGGGGGGSKSNPWGDELSPETGVADTEVEAAGMDLEVDTEATDTTDTEPLIKSEHYRTIISIMAGKKKGEKLSGSVLNPGDEARRVSMSEIQLVKFVKKYPAALSRFTTRHVLRLFPGGHRIDSSNYNPMIGWVHGVQMCALNTQGKNRPLWLAYGMFSANGGCGYVKKPACLLSELVPGSPTGQQQGFNPEQPRDVKCVLKVRVIHILGMEEHYGPRHFDLLSAPDFYVHLGTVGVSADTLMKKTKTRKDAWHPTWEDQTFEFPLRVPELALVRVEVHESDMTEDDFAGQACIPFSELREGFRVVGLNGLRGEELKGPRVLCHFDITTPSFSSKALTEQP